MFEANNISLQVKKKNILVDCSLKVRPGNFTAIVGPNGAGKSSLLKILTGEIKTKTGEVRLNGHPLHQLSSKEQSMLRAVMPQHTNINFPFTIEQVIEIGRFPHATKPSENSNIIDQVIAQTKLDPYKGRTYQTLSGGEKQRVQLARIMAQIWGKSAYTKFLLLDEPTSDLDILHQHMLLGTTKQLLADNIGVLAILHDLNLAAQYADYMIFMQQGKILIQGPTQEVFTKENIENTFNHPVRMLEDQNSGQMIVVPLPNYSRKESKSERKYA